MIEATVEIDAPAWFVRETFLDFENLHKWHAGAWIQSISVLTPNKSSGLELVPGDKMRTVIPGMQFDQTIQINTPEKVQWVGPWYGLLTGTHAYEFTPLPVDTTPGSRERCRVYQWESFTGLLAPTMNHPNYMGGRKTLEAFNGVHADLKAYTEKAWAERSRGRR